VSSIACLGVVGYREISCPSWEWKFGRPVRSPSLYRLSYPGSYIKEINVELIAEEM
jgi:hypothetical protein